MYIRCVCCALGVAGGAFIAGVSLVCCCWSGAHRLARTCMCCAQQALCLHVLRAGHSILPLWAGSRQAPRCKQGAPSGCSAGERSGARMQAHECLRLFEAVRALTPGKNSPKVLETPIWASHLACQPDPCSTNALLGSGGWVEPAGRWRGGCKRPRETREACATAFVCMLRLLPALSAVAVARARTHARSSVRRVHIDMGCILCR